MPRNRSALLIAVGAAVFVVGTGLAFFALRGDDSGSKPTVQAAQTTPTTGVGAVTAPGATAATFDIPTGRQALAVSMPYVNGVAGFVKAGDKVNVFGTIKPGNPAPAPVVPTPAAKLLLSDIKVLSVSAPSAGTEGTTFILALTAPEAEKLVYFQVHEGLYLSLARSDQGRVDAPGHWGPKLW